MRAVQLTDLDAAARTLMCCAAPLRPAMATQLLQNAHIADKYRKRLGKVHPQFGCGTLASAATKFPQAGRICALDPDCLDAFACMIKALASQRLK